MGEWESVWATFILLLGIFYSILILTATLTLFGVGTSIRDVSFKKVVDLIALKDFELTSGMGRHDIASDPSELRETNWSRYEYEYEYLPKSA